MRRPQGISVHKSNGAEYVKLRIWLGSKRNIDGTLNKPYTKVKGLWNTVNITEMVSHRDKVREDFKKGKAPTPDPVPITVPAVCDLAYEKHYTVGRSKGSMASARCHLNSIKEEWPSKAWHTMRAPDIDSFLIGLKMQNSAKKNKLIILKTMFKLMEGWNKRGETNYMIPDHNPAKFVTKMSNTHNRRDRYATMDELRKLKTACHNIDPEMWIHVFRAILTGLRKESLQRVQGKVDLIPSKTSRSSGVRVVLPVSFQGGKIRNFDARWANVKREAGILDLHWHDLRHTSATMLKQLGVPTPDIQEYLGHTQISTTEIYTNDQEARMQPLVDMLRQRLEAV